MCKLNNISFDGIRTQDLSILQKDLSSNLRKKSEKLLIFPTVQVEKNVIAFDGIRIQDLSVTKLEKYSKMIRVQIYKNVLKIVNFSYCAMIFVEVENLSRFYVV